MLQAQQSRISVFLEQMDIHAKETEWFVSATVALDGVTAETAAWVPPGSNNTIWQIVNHLIYWNEDAIYRIQGRENPNSVETNDESFGEPGNPEDEALWTKTAERLHEVFAQLRDVLSQMEDHRLDESYRNGSPSISRLLSNIMMHDTYHLGQVVLLRKLQSAWPSVGWT